MTGSRHLRSVKEAPADSERRELQRCIAVLFEAVEELHYNLIRDGIYAPSVPSRRCAVTWLAKVHDDLPPHVTQVLLTALTPAVDDETRAVQWATCRECTDEIGRITDDPEMVRWHFNPGDRIGPVADAAVLVVERLRVDRAEALAVLVPDVAAI